MTICQNISIRKRNWGVSSRSSWSVITAQRAILFGSYARKEADKGSDIDLIIVGGENFDPTDVFALADDLHRATGKDVDVYEMSEINAGTDFYRTILSEGVQIA